MKESEAAAIWQGYVHGEGTARDDVELALPFSLVWSGKGIKTFTATGDLPVVEGEPVLFEIWVCADGYWADHTKNLVLGELKPEYAELEEQLLAVYAGALERVHGRDRRWPTSTGSCLARSAIGTRRIRSVTASARAPTSRPIRTRPAAATFEENMVLAVEPGVYWEGGGGLRVEDNFLVTADGLEKLSAFPDGVVRC